MMSLLPAAELPAPPRAHRRHRLPCCHVRDDKSAPVATTRALESSFAIICLNTYPPSVTAAQAHRCPHARPGTPWNIHAPESLCASPAEPSLPHQLVQDGRANAPQVAGEDQVIVLRRPSQVGKVSEQGIGGSRRHCRAHLVGILDAQVQHAADGGFGHRHLSGAPGHHHRSCPRHSVLRCRFPLYVELDGIPELPLSRLVMTAGDRDGYIGVARVHHGGGHYEPFGARGARAVQPEEGRRILGSREGGGDYLVQEVAAHHQVDVLRLQTGVSERYIDGVLHEPALGFLGSPLPVHGVVHYGVEPLCQRALRLHGPNDGPGGHDGWAACESEAASDPALLAHVVTSRSTI